MKKVIMIFLVGFITLFLIKIGSLHVLADLPTASNTITQYGTLTSPGGVGSWSADYHRYHFQPMTWNEATAGINNMGVYNFNASFPVVFEFRIPAFTTGQYYTGHVNIPVQVQAPINSALIQAISDGVVQGGSYNTLAYSLTVLDSNDEHLRFSQFQDGSVLYLTCYFDNYQYLGGIEIVCNFDWHCDLALMNLAFVLNEPRYQPFATAYFSKPDNKTLTGYYEQGQSLSTVIANGINNSTDIDTLLLRVQSCVSYLSSISSDVSDLGSILSEVGDINTLLSSMYTEIQNQTGQYNSALSGLSSALSDLQDSIDDFYSLINSDVVDYLQSIDSNTDAIWARLVSLSSILSLLQSQLTDPTDHYQENLFQLIANTSDRLDALSYRLGYDVNNPQNITLRSQLANIIGYLSPFFDDHTISISEFDSYLSAISSSISSANMKLDTLSSMYSTMSNMYSYQHRILSAICGTSYYPSASDTAVIASARAHWISIIQDALDDIEVIIDVDPDTQIYYNITNYDVQNFYNSHEIVNTFQFDVSSEFANYMALLDFGVLHNPSPAIVSARVGVTSLIEQFYNLLGDLRFLIIVTLLIGLVSALMGPINRFVRSRIH